MIIKKYVGKTEEEATEQAQKELGSNVVVLNVRSTKAKGFFSFLKPQLKEVTVALEEESEKTVAAKAEELKGKMDGVYEADNKQKAFNISVNREAVEVEGNSI